MRTFGTVLLLIGLLFSFYFVGKVGKAYSASREVDPRVSGPVTTEQLFTSEQALAGLGIGIATSVVGAGALAFGSMRKSKPRRSKS